MKHLSLAFHIRFSAFLTLLTFLFAVSIFFGTASLPALPTEGETPTERIRTVVLDAGHGGEDGGAVSITGEAEKEINLRVTLLLRDLLEANGIRVILTRERDELLYDRSVDYHGRKKALDLAAREKIAEEHLDAVFVSIHMNTHPMEGCHGLQVWYSPNHGWSHTLAERIQEVARERLDPQNGRTVKQAGSRIYLLDRIQSPAVLVECGFLSNPKEAKLLSSPEYQGRVARAIFLAISQAEFDSSEA